MNNVILSGNVTKPLELNQTSTGKSVCQFTIGINRYSANASKGPMFVKCVAFEKTAENLVKYCDKGSKVIVMGELDITTYNTQDGIKKTAVTVTARTVEYVSSPDNAENGTKPQTAIGKLEQMAIQMDTDDDLPF